MRALHSPTRIHLVTYRHHGSPGALRVWRTPLTKGAVTARIFQDSAGTTWEVFQVHRASEAPRGVSTGLEHGWLAFVSAQGKRRLAPFPVWWESASAQELERLCAAARVANPARFGDAMRNPPTPLERGSRSALPWASPFEGGTTGQERPQVSVNLVRDAVRRFAHEARGNRLSAVNAMIQLKALLDARFGGPDVSSETASDAKDLRKVRRWFVEAFYFDRRS